MGSKAGIRMNGNALDLTGQRFGKLTAIRPTKKRDRSSVIWLCKCDCGHECEVSTIKLRRLTVKSCGCMKKGRGIRDLSGQSFGRLTAVRPTDKREASSVVWFCKCNCGGTKEVSSHNLLSHRVKSCGCMKKGRSCRDTSQDAKQ